MTAAYDHIKSRMACRTYIDNPVDATVARKIAWVPMGKNFLALVAFVSGTGVLTFKIFCADESDGTGNVTAVVAHAGPTDADAEGDLLHLEVSAEQVHAASATGKYVAVEMDNDHADDINAVTYIMDGALVGGRFNYAALTADVIAP